MWFIHVFALFPLLAVMRCLFLNRKTLKSNICPPVSVIIPVYNEERHIAQKMENILSQDYPHEMLEVIVASDGSTDTTEKLVRKNRDPRLRLLALSRRGKNAAIRDAAKTATGNLLIFTDADAMWMPRALRKLAEPFADPLVGGVAGDVYYSGKPTRSKGERAHWNFDRMLRRFLSRAGSVTSATGQIYAVRRSLFEPVPAGVADDFYISSNVILKGYRLVFEPAALSSHPPADTADELSRKIRMFTIGLRAVWKQKVLMNPVKYGFYSIQLITMKILRKLVFIPVTAMSVVSVLNLQKGIVFRAFSALVCAGIVLAGVGWILRNTKYSEIRLFAFPLYFAIVNVAGTLGLAKALFSANGDAWRPRRES